MERAGKFDFVRWVASGLRAKVVCWTVVLLRNKPSGYSNQHNCPLLVSRKLGRPTRVRMQSASIPAHTKQNGSQLSHNLKLNRIKKIIMQGEFGALKPSGFNACAVYEQTIYASHSRSFLRYRIKHGQALVHLAHSGKAFMASTMLWSLSVWASSCQPPRPRVKAKSPGQPSSFTAYRQ